MSIIKNIGEVQEFFPASLSLDIRLITPVFPDVLDKYIKPFLSSEQLALLVTWYDDNKPEETISAEGGGTTVVKYLETLLPYVQRALVRFSIFISIAQNDLKLTGAGFSVTSNQTLSPASPERVKAFKESMENSSWDAIELLLRFLEENKANYTAWSGSDAYTLANKNFVNSALEFNETVGIDQSRLAFYRMRNTIDRVEYLNIESVISKALADDIKTEIKEDDISEVNAVILPLIKKAVIFFTAAEDIDQKYKGMADHYLADVKKILDANPDSYPLYRESGFYTGGVSYPSYENNEVNSFFVFGAKQ